jgi:hypothetical protein
VALVAAARKPGDGAVSTYTRIDIQLCIRMPGSSSSTQASKLPVNFKNSRLRTISADSRAHWIHTYNTGCSSACRWAACAAWALAESSCAR